MIGAAVGFLAQSEIAALGLALIGVLAGHFYDILQTPLGSWNADDARRPGRNDRRPSRPRPTPPRAPPPEDAAARTQRDLYARKLCTLFVELARVDGQVGREEVRAMREYFQQDLGYEGASLDRIRNWLKAAIATRAELDAAARAVSESLEPQARTFLLDALYDLALVDGTIQRSERDALRKLAQALNVPEEAHRAVTARYFGKGDAHYAELGLTPDASDEELRSAFRKLATQHHPDKAAHLGPKAVEDASRRFQRIKDAYEELRRLRGI